MTKNHLSAKAILDLESSSQEQGMFILSENLLESLYHTLMDIKDNHQEYGTLCQAIARIIKNCVPSVTKMPQCWINFLETMPLLFGGRLEEIKNYSSCIRILVEKKLISDAIINEVNLYEILEYTGTDRNKKVLAALSSILKLVIEEKYKISTLTRGVLISMLLLKSNNQAIILKIKQIALEIALLTIVFNKTNDNVRLIVTANSNYQVINAILSALAFGITTFKDSDIFLPTDLSFNKMAEIYLLDEESKLMCDIRRNIISIAAYHLSRGQHISESLLIAFKDTEGEYPQAYDSETLIKIIKSTYQLILSDQIPINQLHTLLTYILKSSNDSVNKGKEIYEIIDCIKNLFQKNKFFALSVKTLDGLIAVLNDSNLLEAMNKQADNAQKLSHLVQVLQSSISLQALALSNSFLTQTECDILNIIKSSIEKYPVISMNFLSYFLKILGNLGKFFDSRKNLVLDICKFLLLSQKTFTLDTDMVNRIYRELILFIKDRECLSDDCAYVLEFINCSIEKFPLLSEDLLSYCLSNLDTKLVSLKVLFQSLRALQNLLTFQRSIGLNNDTIDVIYEKLIFFFTPERSLQLNEILDSFSKKNKEEYIKISSLIWMKISSILAYCASTKRIIPQEAVLFLEEGLKFTDKTQEVVSSLHYLLENSDHSFSYSGLENMFRLFQQYNPGKTSSIIIESILTTIYLSFSRKVELLSDSMIRNIMTCLATGQENLIKLSLWIIRLHVQQLSPEDNLPRFLLQYLVATPNTFDILIDTIYIIGSMIHREAGGKQISMLKKCIPKLMKVIQEPVDDGIRQDCIELLKLAKELGVYISEYALEANIQLGRLDEAYQTAVNKINGKVCSVFGESTRLLMDTLIRLIDVGWSFESVDRILDKIIFSDLRGNALTPVTAVVNSLVESYIEEDSRDEFGETIVEILSHSESETWLDKIDFFIKNASIVCRNGVRDIDELTSEILRLNEDPEMEQLIKSKLLHQFYNSIVNSYASTSQILKNEKTISCWEKNDCLAWAEIIKSQQDLANDNAYLPEMIAVIKRANILDSGKDPRCIQILSLYFLLHSKSSGVLAQISTGEGKSTIVAMLSVIQVLRGRRVDIVTSSIILAKRDVNEKKSFFDIFGLTTADNDNSDSYVEEEKPAYSADIVYGSSYTFQWDLLWQAFKIKDARGDRPYDFVIVDEVDNMLVDGFNDSAQIASRPKGVSHFASLFLAIDRQLQAIKKNLSYQENQWVYQDVDKAIEYVIEDVNVFLIKILEDAIRSLLDSPKPPIFIPPHLREFVLSNIKDWAWSAVHVDMNLKLGKDYVITDNDTSDTQRSLISPLNCDTGFVLVGNVWSRGLQQFAEIKNDLPISPLNTSGLSISNITFFKRYKNICGLTGTLGQEQETDLLRQIYSVQTVYLPTYKEKKLTQQKIILADGHLEWLQSIIDSVQPVLQERAALIICECINDVDAISEALKPYAQNISRYARNDTAEVDIIERSFDPGDVLIATNLAGRGTDLKLLNSVNKAGGLHVCLTYLPLNMRVEKQAIGRTARQGNPGTAQLVIDIEKTFKQLNRAHPIYNIDQFRAWFNPANNIDPIMEIKNWRDAAEKERISRIYNRDIERILFKDSLVSNFSSFIRELHESQLSAEYNKLLEKKESLLKSRKKLLESSGLSETPKYRVDYYDGERVFVFNDIWLCEYELNRVINELERIKPRFALKKIDAAKEAWGFYFTKVCYSLYKDGEVNLLALRSEFDTFIEKIKLKFRENTIQNPCDWLSTGNALHNYNAEEAVRYYDKAIDQDPVTCLYAFYNRAALKLNQNNYEGALHDLSVTKQYLSEFIIPAKKTAIALHDIDTNSENCALTEALDDEIKLCNLQIEHIDHVISTVQGAAPGSQFKVNGILPINKHLPENSFSKNLVSQAYEEGFCGFLDLEVIPPPSEEDDDDDGFFGAVCSAITGVVSLGIAMFLPPTAPFLVTSMLGSLGIAGISLSVQATISGKDVNLTDLVQHVALDTAITIITMGVAAAVEHITNAGVNVKSAAEIANKTKHRLLASTTRGQVLKNLAISGAKEMAHIALSKLTQDAISFYEEDIRKYVKDEILSSMGSDEIKKIFSDIYSRDHRNGELNGIKLLMKNINDLLVTYQSHAVSIGRVILKGVVSRSCASLGNLHSALPVIPYLMQLGEICNAIEKIKSLSFSFGRDFANKMVSLNRQLVVNLYSLQHANLEKITIIFDAFINEIANKLTQLIVSQIQNNVVSPITRTFIELYSNSLLKKVEENEQESKVILLEHDKKSVASYLGGDSNSESCPVEFDSSGLVCKVTPLNHQESVFIPPAASSTAKLLPVFDIKNAHRAKAMADFKYSQAYKSDTDSADTKVDFRLAGGFIPSMGLFREIVSHATTSDVVRHVIENPRLIENSKNMYGKVPSFYLSESGVGWAQLDKLRGKEAYCIAYTLDSKINLFDHTDAARNHAIVLDRHEFGKKIFDSGYDGIKHQGYANKSNGVLTYDIALFKEQKKFLTPVGIYPVEAEKWHAEAPTGSYRFRNAISNGAIRTSQLLGLAGTAASITNSVEEVIKSDNRVIETLHQSALLGSSVWGGSTAFFASLIPCGTTVGAAMPLAAPITVPVCGIVASTVGGVVASAATELLWQGGENMIKESLAQPEIDDIYGVRIPVLGLKY